MSKKSDSAAMAAKLRGLVTLVASGKLYDSSHDWAVVVEALQGYANILEGVPQKNGRWTTPFDLQLRIAFALAWVDSNRQDIPRQRRPTVVELALDVAPRALTTVPQWLLDEAASKLRMLEAAPFMQGLMPSLRRPWNDIEREHRKKTLAKAEAKKKGGHG